VTTQIPEVEATVRFRGFRPLLVYGDQQLYQRITFATIDLPSLAAIYLLTIGAIT
jgi:hypothetical protein